MPAGFTGCKPKAWCHRFELAFSQIRPDEKKESAIAFLKDAGLSLLEIECALRPSKPKPLRRR